MSKWQHTPKVGRYSIELIVIYFVRGLQAVRQLWGRPVGNRSNFSSLKSFVFLFLLGTSLSIAIASCAGKISDAGGAANATGNKNNVQLTLVSYSVTKAAYDRIIPKFEAQWKKEHNQNVTVNGSYGASGSQATAVINGLEADVVHLSLALDVDKIVKAGLIQPGWETEAPSDGIVTKSVGVIATREGNPKNIKNWADLAKNGINVMTPDPKTSGGARWNFLAIWGFVTRTGGDENTALDLTTKVYKNAPVLPVSARAASDLFFKQGKGDALITYENEMILSEQFGDKLPYTVPDVNISIDNPIAVVDKNVDKHGTREIAEAFVKFLYTPEAQREFAAVGFRPVNPTVVKEVENKFPKVQTLFTAKDLGGWGNIQNKFFDDGAIFDKIHTKKS
ncbi:sulfate ABC transporter substrate-binding protein [Aerosakkonema funiforme]|uniref:sulfate ABC transporter substrate-binding protein n=1 Tax=Aerosakkonema funiforme TaxID=1246630 RepID=UPI0035BB8F26